MTVEREPLHVNKKLLHGPFDIVGDVHGCLDELTELLTTLGYRIEPDSCPEERGYVVTPPEGRTLIFLGDLVDRGPKSPDVLRLAMGMVAAGTARCVPGNHDVKLARKLKGGKVQLSHGLAESLAQLDPETSTFREQVAAFIDGLVSHYVLDDGKLVVAHAGMKEVMQGRASGGVRDFALYGETTGETDEFGLPVRYNWADEYRGSAMVVYGHTPVPEAEWQNRTINIDTGCVFGGKLTALRYPEKEIVSVPARATYSAPARPLVPEDRAGSAKADVARRGDVLDITDVLGKRVIPTRLLGNVTIEEENGVAALEAMSRFAADPRWLIYLPPTMSPSDTSHEPGLLEHPAQAFAYFRDRGVSDVICKEKHMGSRAVVIVCRDEAVARSRFGISGDGFGICYTRTGRRFFDVRQLEGTFLTRIRTALDLAGTWPELGTDWVCLDCELMPWSAKAQELIRQQYAGVGAASQHALSAAVKSLRQATAQGLSVQPLVGRYEERAAMADRFIAAYRRYCWPVRDVSDLRLAPFHLLASEGAVHVDRDHSWHLKMLARLADADPGLVVATSALKVDVTNPASKAAGVKWWEDLTQRGAEGMVIKPLSFIAPARRGIVQPALKCRGPEYLRIVYGPDYSIPENLERLRSRSVGKKGTLALREFALGIEALERFVRAEPLYRVHECVFGVLALESEPVDPRL